MRRLATFLVMIAAGFALVVLFSDEMLETSGGRQLTGTSEDGDPSPGITLSTQESHDGTRLTVGAFTSPVMRAFEVSPGVFEERKAYLISADGATPGLNGQFLITKPVVTFHDLETGDERGRIWAERGIIETGKQSSGDFSVRVDALNAEAFSLIDDVRGEFLVQGEGDAHLQAERLDWDGATITGPGLVVWSRDDVTLSGIDMTWHEATGKVTYARDAELQLTAADLPHGTLHSPEGLLWFLPPRDETERGDSGGLGHGELLGPITGTFDDGSQLSGRRLLVAGDTGALTLIGEAFVERSGQWRATADELTVADDGSGVFELVNARGRADADVLLEQLGVDGAVTAWLRTPLLETADSVMVAADPSRWHVAGIDGFGTGLRWERPTGRITTNTNTRLEGRDGAMKGATLNAAGGIDVTLPPGAVDPRSALRGVLRGPVGGTLADGTSVFADEVLLDGPAGSVALIGTPARATDPEGVRLTGQRLELFPDERNELSDVAARGEVEFRQPQGHSDLVVTSEQIDLTGGIVTATAQFHAVQGLLSLSGVGARWDEAGGEFSVARDATIDREPELEFDSEGNDIMVRPGMHLDAPNGLIWTMPEDQTLGAAQGHGELRGPVNGTSTAGGTLRATDRVLVFGAEERMQLFGDARVGMTETRWLEGATLDLDLTEADRRVTSPGQVSYAMDTLTGAGVGLTFDEALGLTRIESDCQLRILGSDGRQEFALTSDGPVEWNVPPGAVDVIGAGRGEAFDNVVAVDDTGSRFETDHLVFDGPQQKTRLLGPSSLALITPDGPADLAAAESIEIERGSDGELVELVATEDVDGRYQATDSVLEFTARVFTLDRDVNAILFDGPFHVEQQLPGDELRTLDGMDDSRLTVIADSNNDLVSVSGGGRFKVDSGKFTLFADSLDWDLPEDHLMISGDCRLFGGAAWVRAPLIEVWPEARRYHIPLPVLALDHAGG